MLARVCTAVKRASLATRGVDAACVAWREPPRSWMLVDAVYCPHRPGRAHVVPAVGGSASTAQRWISFSAHNMQSSPASTAEPAAESQGSALSGGPVPHAAAESAQEPAPGPRPQPTTRAFALMHDEDPADGRFFDDAQVSAAIGLFRPRSGEKAQFLGGSPWANKLPMYDAAQRAPARARDRRRADALEKRGRQTEWHGPATEVAFFGRSNVGKSTLLNAALGAQGLARTSKTPGRTQQINLFAPSCGPGFAVIVDLPGYGHAKAPAHVARAWRAMAERYLRDRFAEGRLARCFLLLDCRRGISPIDLEVMDMLAAAKVPTQVVVTKADKLARGRLDMAVKTIRLNLPRHDNIEPWLLVVSAKDKLGIVALRTAVASAVGALDPLKRDPLAST